MKLNSRSSEMVGRIIASALEKFRVRENNDAVTDIYIQATSDSGELRIYDDDDNLLSCGVVEEWIDYNDDDFDDEAAQLLKKKISSMYADDKSLQDLKILKPYSFVLIDDKKETIADLYIVDDDTVIVDDELLKGLDEELDDFIKGLLDEK